MTPDDIFELARKKTPPPDNLDLPQRMLYSIARNLYQSFGANILSLEQAREEKKQAIRAYNDYHHAELEAKRLRDDILKLHAQLIPAIERGERVIHTRNGVSAEYNISGAELKFSKDNGWVYSVILTDRKANTVVYAAVDDVEVQDGILGKA